MPTISVWPPYVHTCTYTVPYIQHTIYIRKQPRNQEERIQFEYFSKQQKSNPKNSRPEESKEVPQGPRRHCFSNTIDFLLSLKTEELHVEMEIEHHREEEMHEVRGPRGMGLVTGKSLLRFIYWEQ